MSARGAGIPHGDQMPDLVALFGEAFPRGKGDVFMARAPGRVNLIGEHTDYNDGFVLPVAIDREVCALGQRRPDDRVVVYSANFKRRVSFELDALGRSERQTWINYPQGVADALQRAGYHLPGMNLLLWGNIPPGGGRCRHVVTENARVGLAAAALRAGDTERLGALFAASQDSMRDDYAVSLPEIDALVEIARAHGALASRMTGGGFGGCTVNLVPEAAWEGFTRGVAADYPARTRRKPVIFRCCVVDGASLE